MPDMLRRSLRLGLSNNLGGEFGTQKVGCRGVS